MEEAPTQAIPGGRLLGVRAGASGVASRVALPWRLPEGQIILNQALCLLCLEVGLAAAMRPRGVVGQYGTSLFEGPNGLARIDADRSGLYVSLNVSLLAGVASHDLHSDARSIQRIRRTPAWSRSNMTEKNSTLTYSEYLQLHKILGAQRLRSTEHSEMLFIVSHQVYELWFKQTICELELLQSQLEAGDTSRALRSLRRILAIFRVMLAQLEVLESMTPMQFNNFRDLLEASSGFESAQFREIEAILGRRDVQVITRYPEGSPERSRLAAAMSRPCLFDSFVRYLETQGCVVPAEIRDREVDAPVSPCVDLQKMLVKLYVADLEPVGVCECLVDLDEAMQEWRYRHVKMVERIIGAKRGSSGSAGAAYLKTTLDRPAFPDLWGMRTLS